MFPTRVLPLLVVVWGAVGGDCVNVVHPWRAAEAVLELLPGDAKLKNVDPHSLQVLCGQRTKFGLEVNGVPYEVNIGDKSDWKELRTVGVKGSEGVELRVNGDCSLPGVTLWGPLEVTWLQESRARLIAPPEASSLTQIDHLILHDAVSVQLNGLKELHLQEPVSFHGVKSGGSMGGVTREGSGGSEIWHGDGQRTARWVRLEAAAVSDSFSVQYLPETPFTAAETSPGTLTLFPLTSDGVSHVERRSWLWPFLEAFPLTASPPYEALLEHILQQQQHQNHPSVDLVLRTASSQAVTLVHFIMDVQMQGGSTEILEAYVSVDGEHYTPVDAQLLTTHHSITMSLHDTISHNFTWDPFLPFYDIHL